MAKLRARAARDISALIAGINVGTNVNVSNEPGPQSETFIAVDTQAP